MSFKTVKSVAAYFEHDEYGSFELPFSGDFYRESIKVSDDGLSAVLGMLCVDDSPEDPFEVFDEGEFHQFDCDYVHYAGRPDIEEWKRIIRANPGRVVSVDHFGESTYKPSQLMTAAMCRGDKRTGENSKAESILDDMDGYYIAPDDVTDVYKYAKGVLETYSAWCNGDVYGVLVWQYVRDDIESSWNLVDRDRECWGFYGCDYAEQELGEQFERTNFAPAPAGNLNQGE